MSEKSSARTARTSDVSSAASVRTFATIGSAQGSTGVTGTKPPTGYVETLIHLVKGYIATGIFSMGVAFKFSGMILGPLLLGMIAILNLHCQHLLLKTAEKIASQEVEDVKPSFVETVQYTMRGSKFKWLSRNSARFGTTALVFVCFTEMSFCCVYFIFIAKHLLMVTSHYNFLREDHDEYIMLAIILGPMWLSTFLGSLKMLLPLSVIANILMSIAVIFVFYYSLKDGACPAQERNMAITQIGDVPLFFGMTLYAFEGITFIMPLRNEMKEPEKFISTFGVLNVGMTIVFILLCAVGLLAYCKYGETIKPSFFLDIQDKGNKRDILGDVVICTISLAVLFTFTIHMYIPFELSYPHFHRKFGPFKYDCLAMGIYRSVPVLITYSFAHIGSSLDLFIALVGSSTGAMLALILPAMLETIAFWDELKMFHFVKNILIVTFGIIGAIIGTTISIFNIIVEFSK